MLGVYANHNCVWSLYITGQDFTRRASARKHVMDMWNSKFCRFAVDSLKIFCFSGLYLIHHSIRQIGVLISFSFFFAPLIHHDQTVSTDSRGDRQSTTESWTLVHTCFWPQMFTHTHNMHTHTHIMISHQQPLSCYPSVNMKAIRQRISVCACCEEKMTVNSEHVLWLHCIVVYWACCQWRKSISLTLALTFSLYDLSLQLRSILQWNRSSCI